MSGFSSAYLLRQPFAHSGVRVRCIAGIGKTHVAINHDAQRPPHRQIGNRKGWGAVLFRLRALRKGSLRQERQRRQSRSKNQTALRERLHPYRPPPTKCTISRLVPVAQARIRPLRAGNYVPVMFDRHPVAFKTELGNQILQVGPGHQLRKFTRLPVQDEIHRGRVSLPPTVQTVGEPITHCLIRVNAG